jgi:SAM-dependent methyltransferase
MTGGVPFEYVGSELELFEKATNWKRYWSERVGALIHGDVLEVGAGIGANTKLFTKGSYRSWTCLEPDPALARQIRGDARIVVGQIADLVSTERFDTILYIDVLEHIEDHCAELLRAAPLLRAGGHLIVLAPAHSCLYAPFDAAVGHFRRYNRASLRAAAAPCGLRELAVTYLDCAGLAASDANRLLLRQAMPTERQILTWDRLLIPVSRALDPLLAHRAGKSVVGIWSK